MGRQGTLGSCVAERDQLSSSATEEPGHLRYCCVVDCHDAKKTYLASVPFCLGVATE